MPILFQPFGPKNAGLPGGSKTFLTKPIALDMSSQKRRLSAVGTGLSVIILVLTATQAGAGLKTIKDPQGGKIVYGQVEGQTNEANAMAYVLREIHKQFDDRPQLSKLFQVRGSQSVAAFFTVTRRTQGGGQLAGMIIVAKVTTDHVEAAVVSDDADRFASTLNPMMKTLFSAWHPFEAATAARAVASNATADSGAPAAALKQVILPDHSASVSIPEDWQITPTSGGGTVYATGPHDEVAQLGVAVIAHDPNNPSVARTMRIVQQGGLKNTIYANAIYYPYGGDLEKSFVDIIHKLQTRAGKPEANYQFTNSTPLAFGPAQRAIHLVGTADLQDGKGLREVNIIYCTTPPLPASGIWMSLVYATGAPVEIAKKERATLAAILQSYHVDSAVVKAQADASAAPEIARIHAIGKAAADQAAAAHSRNDIQNSSVYQHWDDLDKRSKEFSNYQLGYSVIQDNSANAHGTLWNEEADSLVRHDPQRYEYVNAPNFWKGIDY
jgi:hypothetical protein